MSDSVILGRLTVETEFPAGAAVLMARPNLVKPGLTAGLVNPAALAEKGVAGGYAGLDADGTVPWSQMKAELRMVPLGISVPGKPAAGLVLNVAIVFATTIPANFAGTQTIAGIVATAAAVVKVNTISGGVTTPLGAITVTAGNMQGATLSEQPEVVVPGGGALQFVFPDPQDATLANFSATLLAMRV